MSGFSDAFMRNDQNAAVQARTKAQNRANVLQLKLIGQSHPTGLTPNLLKLFEPRPPLEFKQPPEKRKCPPYTGMAQYVSHFAEPTDPEYAPPVPEVETRAQKKARIRQLRLENGASKAAEELEKYDPNNDANVTGDPYKTLFVARISYETTESRLKREFETYGPIKRVKMVYDKESNKPRGYAFIEYAHTRDMKAAYKQGDGRKIDGRRVLVDVERGRTVPNWRPRRLGGGLGTSRAGGEDGIERPPGRETQSSGPFRSQEPRVRDEREKSRERVREKDTDREKSRERSHDRPRDREHREDRHHRDRERTRDRDRERDRNGRDRDREHRDRDRGRQRERGRDRSGHDHEKERDRGHTRDKERDYDMEETGNVHHRGHSYDRDYEYDHMDSKYDRDKHGERGQGCDHGGPDYDQGWYHQSEQGHSHLLSGRDGKHYNQYGHPHGLEYGAKVDGEGDQDSDRYGHYAGEKDQCDQMDQYNYDRPD